MKTLQTTNKENAFDFLNYVHERLLKKFYSQGLEPKVSHKEINQYLSVLLRFDKKTTRNVLLMLQEKALIELQRNSGNGNFWIVIKNNEVNKNE